MSSSSYDELLRFYILHDELGQGGFGKVKLATHILTGEKVAIKIIDKKSLGNDLPRVKTEMDALRSLSHQNICRLYHYIETHDKFFIVLEFCSGGEMFDYIIRKRRLEESEARHFFRQLVSAMAYVHSQGFAHRDLKPENLLLTEDLLLKVIDFGLCAKAAGRLESHHLDTCCGSPAYAAPELILGRLYKGNEADIWSMGVLLYTLLCGQLPFEDDNLQLLYRKISHGYYEEPSDLSPSCRDLMRSMIKVNPEERITMDAILQHPWINHKYSHPIKWNTIYDKNVIDEDIARELAFYNRKSLAQMVAQIKKWEFDELTATYYLLLHKKRRGSPYALPMPPKAKDIKGKPATSNVLGSPTIHASLETNLDRSGLEDELDACMGGLSSGSSEQLDAPPLPPKSNKERKKRESSSECEEKVRFARPHSPDRGDVGRNSKISYINAMLNMPSQFTGRSPKSQLAGNCTPRIAESPKASDEPVSFTPVRQGRNNGQSQAMEDIQKENVLTHYVRSGAATCSKARGPLKVQAMDEGTCRSIYTTPNRKPLHDLFSPGGPDVASTRQRARSTERGVGGGGSLSSSTATSTTATTTSTTSSQMGGGSPASIGSVASGGNADGRTPRSTTKTPRIRTRVFTSLERKAERVINLLTPRKVKHESPQVIKSIKNMVNVSLTSSTTPERVREELVKVFEQQMPEFQLNGWKISGRIRGNDNKALTVELEVVILENCGRKVGIKRKRLNGDAFLYKRMCEKILQMADL